VSGSGNMSGLLQAARLWERTSAKGNRYLSGRLGGVKVVIMANRDFDAEDPVKSHTHTMFFADGSATSPKPADQPPAERRERPRSAEGRGNRGQIEDDAVPF